MRDHKCEVGAHYGCACDDAELIDLQMVAQIAVDEYEKADDGEWTGSPLDRAWAELKRRLRVVG